MLDTLLNAGDIAVVDTNKIPVKLEARWVKGRFYHLSAKVKGVSVHAIEKH